MDNTVRVWFWGRRGGRWGSEGSIEANSTPSKDWKSGSLHGMQLGRYCRSRSKQIQSDTWIKSVIVFISWTFDKVHLNALFKVVSASCAARLIGLFSFHSNSLNMAEMRKRADGWDNGADSQSVYLPVCIRTQTHTHARAKACPFVQRRTHARTHSCVHLRAHGQMRMATRDLDGVDNETASDPVHLWFSVHYPNGHHSLLLITAPSLSLLRCSCRFSSRYLSAHLHQFADGFRGRWWNDKSEAEPGDYHHRDQLSTHSSTLKPQMSSLGRIHNSLDVHNGSPMGGRSSVSAVFVQRVADSARARVLRCVFEGGTRGERKDLWVTRAVMESFPWCEVLGPFEIPSTVKMSSVI